MQRSAELGHCQLVRGSNPLSAIKGYQDTPIRSILALIRGDLLSSLSLASDRGSRIACRCN